MKCVQCGSDSRRRDRRDGRCPRCRRKFAFEPATDRLKVTDVQFKNAVDRVSGGGKVQFTERNLWYELNRRWMKPGFWRSPWGALPFVGAGSAGPYDGSSSGSGVGGGDTSYGGGVIWVGDLRGGADTAAVDGFG